MQDMLRLGEKVMLLRQRGRSVVDLDYALIYAMTH
jgi:hypothetical protein